MQSAIKRASGFLREQHVDTSDYYICLAQYCCSLYEPRDDCWQVLWCARDAKRRPDEYRVVVMNNGKITWGHRVD